LWAPPNQGQRQRPHTTDCDDNKDITQDVCLENECSHNEIEGFCYTKSDCIPSHNDWLCELNKCTYPTTGIYCPASQQGNTRCEDNLVQVCQPNSNFIGSFTWQFSEDCNLLNEVCVD